MRPIWKGAISFGLVNIPIVLYPAIRREELKFKLLRESDQSPINYKRVAEADGKDVPWDQIVKGYEFEKGRFVILKEEDFDRADIEATQTIEITDFVELEEVNPLFFYKPYYLEPEKGGEKAYALLRGALERTGKIGIAKVVIKKRQHLAAVKPQGKGLILELMHFAQELVSDDELNTPTGTSVGGKELEMAETLIGAMSGPWDPEKYRDDYRESVEKLIAEKIANPSGEVPKSAPKKKSSNVIDLVSVLQESIRAAHTTKPTKPSRTGNGKTTRRPRGKRAA